MAGLYETTGLPTAEDVEAAFERMRERFGDVVDTARQDPMLDGVLGRVERADRWYEKLGDRTGLPTYHDIFAKTEALREWVEGQVEPSDEDDSDEDDEERESDEREDDEDDDGRPWWWAIGVGVGLGVLVYKWLEDTDVQYAKDFEFELPGWEIDGIPWTVERTYIPGRPYAARVGEPMLHGGAALPGPGSIDVSICGRPALTVKHSVGACPMPNVVGLPHLPQQGPGAWRTTNGSVYVNGAPLLRAGDWIEEHFGGPNPIIAGAPTVTVGPPGAPCVVQEVTHRRMSDFIPGLENIGSLGGKVSVKGTLKWNALEMVKTVGLGLANVYGGRPGKFLAQALIGSVEGPSIDVEFEVSNRFFADWLKEIDWNDDGTTDVLVEARTTCDATAKSKHTTELDPTNPSKVKKQKDGELETDVDCHRPEVQVHRPGTKREPWKDEKKQ